jgi:hypothetical protein
MQPNLTHTLTVLVDETRHSLTVPHGVNLRRALLDAGRSPYATLTRQCKGAACCAPPWRARPLRHLWRLA